MTGALDTANGDHITTDVTVASGGVIDVTGLFTVDGGLDVVAGGGLGSTLDGRTDYGQIDVGGAADLEGALDVTLGNQFYLSAGDVFDLLQANGGLTDNVTGLYLDGTACSALGGGIYGCGYDKLSLVAAGGGLTLTVDSVPEPATWAMMLAGFASLGFAGWRRAARAPA